MGSEILASTSNFDIESILSDLEVGYQIIGSRKNFKQIRSVAAIDEATSYDFAFCSQNDSSGLRAISESDAGLVLCHNRVDQHLSAKRDQLLVLVDNPRLVFMHVANRLHNVRAKRKYGISQLSCISDTTKVSRTSAVGNFSVIDEGCVVGKNTIIGDRVSLQNCVIGDNCIIQSGVSIGEDGFAYERNESLELEAFPHFGKVIIGNNVEISTNCSVARGSLKDTIIEDGTKIDALTHIAHNANIGRNCSLTAGTIIGGSTTVGDTCWLGLNSTVKHKLKIGNKVIIGSGASVIDDIPDEDIVAGVPARSIKHKVNSNQLFLMAGQIKLSDKKVRRSLHY